MPETSQEKSPNSCQYCGEKEASWVRLRTYYVDDADNHAFLCQRCKEEADEYWREQHEEYYRNAL